MIYSILLIIFLLLFVFLTYKKFNWSIYLLVASLPSYLIRFEIFGIPMTILEAMILILFLVFLIKYKLTWIKSFRQNPFFWPIVAILILSTVSIFTSPNTQGALGIWKAYFVEPVLLLIVLISSTKNKKEFHNIFWALGISALYISLFAIWQFFSAWGVPQAFLNPDGSTDRVVSIFGYPNAISLYLGPIIILFTGFLWQKNKAILQLLKILIIALSAITIILAESEAAIIAIFVVWIFWGLIYKKTRLFSLSIIIISILLFFLNPLINDFLTTKLLLKDWSGIVRRHIWQETWKMLKDNWLFGAGLAGYQTKIIPYHIGKFEIFLYPHSIVFNFWSELGLLGLFSFIWLGILYLWQNLKTILKQREIILSLTLIMIILEMTIHGLVDAPYFKNDLSILFWIFVVITILNITFNRKENQNKKIVSACLAGIKCNYEGKAKPCQKVIDLVNNDRAIPVCPEQLGGLPTPRVPSEITKDKVINRLGQNVTKEFYKGAKIALVIAKDNNCHEAILKSKSPACGYGKIHDGTFSEKLIDGDGVFAKLLKQEGIKIITEKDI